jgi:hypothetical protein
LWNAAGNVEIGAGDASNFGPTYTWLFGNDGGTIFPQLSVQRGDNPSGTITGQTLLFGDAGQEAIISTPDGNPTDGINSQRLVINPGQGNGSGEGGDIYLWAGRGGPTDGSGGDIKIRGGQGMANGTGGYIRIEGGDTQGTGYPGYIDITGGQGSATQGAYVRITGGQGATNGGEAGVIGGYGTDVLDEEPPRADHPLTKLPNCVVTPHIGSRTAESVQRQAVAAVTNLIRAMHGEEPLAQINKEVKVKKVV